MNKELLIGIDIGGTHIKSVLTNPQGEILQEVSRPTLDVEGKDCSATWKNTVRELIEHYLAESTEPIQHIGISTPGTVNDSFSGVISNGTKLLGIEGLIWSDYLDRQVYVLNDAHAALFAESRLGVGQEYQDLLMLTLGTGVGGAIMVNRQLLRGQQGRAGHVGHVSVTQDIAQGIVNTPGSLEIAIGQYTLPRRSYGRYTVTKDLVEDYRAGDTFATWVWLNSVQALARGIISFINILSPEVVILGGGIAKSGAALIKPLKEFMDLYEWRPKGYETPIKFAKLSNHAGAVGAALFAREKATK